MAVFRARGGARRTPAPDRRRVVTSLRAASTPRTAPWVRVAPAASTSRWRGNRLASPMRKGAATGKRPVDELFLGRERARRSRGRRRGRVAQGLPRSAATPAPAIRTRRGLSAMVRSVSDLAQAGHPGDDGTDSRLSRRADRSRPGLESWSGARCLELGSHLEVRTDEREIIDRWSGRLGGKPSSSRRGDPTSPAISAPPSRSSSFANHHPGGSETRTTSGLSAATSWTRVERWQRRSRRQPRPGSRPTPRSWKATRQTSSSASPTTATPT